MITKPKHFVQRDGGKFVRKEFTIAATPEAFRILSDGLYSKKIEAVIRELSTNAVDAHIVAENDDVFEVHLPSFEEPWFVVRDYGTGMSHDDVMDLYSTYFGTNKADDLNTTGCLGLGSKSPLAKVRSFTVVSRFDGMERHYIVTLNEDRIPEVDHLVEQSKPTTDSGMEIQMAVATSDISEYIRKAAQVYFHFDAQQRPRIINGRSYELSKPEILIEGTGWRMYKGAGTPVAVQGSVGYPIASAQIKHIKPHHEMVLSCNLEIDFPNGSVHFTPSREHLSYDKTTCRSLTSRLDKIVSEVNDMIGKRFDTCTTLWEARTLAYDMFWTNSADLRHLHSLAETGEITWKGQKIAGKQLSFSDIQGVAGWSFETRRNRNNYWDKNTKVSRNERSIFTPRGNVVWCETDIPRGSYSRCHQYIQDHQDTCIYLVSFSAPKARQEFCDEMGLDGTEFIKTSTMPKPVSTRSGSGKLHRSTSLVYKHIGGVHRTRLYQYWKKTEVDLDNGEGGVYVEMKNNKVVNPQGHRVEPTVVSTLVSLLDDVGQEHIEVIGVRPQVAKRFRKSDDWVDLFTYARHVVEIEVVQKQLAQHIVNAEHLRDLTNSSIWCSMMQKADALGKLDKTMALHKLIEDLQHMQKSNDACRAYSHWRTLATECGVSLDDVEPERYISVSIENMYSQYPMLELILDIKTSNYHHHPFQTNELQHIRHYVSLVESQNCG